MQLFGEARSWYRDDKKIFDGYGYFHLNSILGRALSAFNLKKGTQVVFFQTLGEAVTVFKEIYLTKSSNATPNAFFLKELEQGEKMVALHFEPSAYLKSELKLPEEISSYRVKLCGKKIEFAAFDKINALVKEDEVPDICKYFVVFMAFVGLEMLTSNDFNVAMLDFAKVANKEKFVYAYALLQSAHRRDVYDNVVYKDLIDLGTQTDWKYLYPVYAEPVEIKTIVVQEEKPVFSEELLEFVPKLGPEFVMPTKFNDIARAIYKGDIRTLLLHGPAGTGKTSTCKLIAQTIGFPVVEVINCTENLDEFVLGKYIPMDDKIVFKESGVTTAIRDGGVVVFEEINFARPQYLAFLNSLLDDNGFVRLDSGETVRRNKNFRFFATMNVGYFGTKELNQALYNRFNCIAEVPALEDAAIIRMLETRVPECKSVTAKMLRVYNKIRIMIEEKELDIVISPRNLENWARLARYQGYVEAAETTIVPVARNDKDIEDAIRDIINTFKWK